MKTGKWVWVMSLLFCLLASTFAGGQEAMEGTWFPNNEVRQMTRGDGKIFMSGDFDWFGVEHQQGFVVLDEELALDNTYPDGENYFAQHAVSDDAGGWYFASYSTISHMKADKTIEEIPLLFEGGGYPINAIEKVGNILYIGGNFTTVNSVAKNYVAAIDLTTNTLTSWNPNPSGYVYTLKAAGSVVYVGGSFTTIGGQTRPKIAAIDVITGLATSWNANVINAAGGYVYTIAVDASNVYFGGNFSNVASSTPSRRNFAAVNTTTGAVTTFNPRPDGYIVRLLLDGTTLYIAGDYTVMSGQSKSTLVAMDVTTGLFTSFSVDFNNFLYGTNKEVYALAIDGQKLFIGGYFLTVNDVERARLAVVDKTTGVLEPMADREMSTYVLSIAISGGKVLVGGPFRGISGLTNSLRCAVLDEVTGQGVGWIPEMPHLPGSSYPQTTYLHYQNDQVYYWHDLYFPMDDYGGAQFGAFNATDGSAIPGWSVDVDGYVDAWAFSNDALYLAGDFTEVNGTVRNGFAAVDLETGALLPWTISYSPDYAGDEMITAMMVYNNVLYVSGDFTFDDNGERNNLAAWNATTGAINSWAPEITLTGFQQLRIHAIHNSKVYIGGSELVRVDATSGEIDDDWQLDLAGGSVNSVVVQGNSVFVAGSFSPGLVRADITTGEISEWQPEFEDVEESEGSIATIAISETRLFVGGNFNYEIEGVEHGSFAVYVLPTPTNDQPLTVYNALSPNGDGKNEMLLIQYVDILPETKSNKVTIFNRWGDVVFEVSNYNNADRVFKGQNNNGKDLPSGTYFYKIEFSKRSTVTGFLSLRR